MSAQLKAGETLTIDDTPYLIGEHPAAPGMPYGQEGRQAVVYQLIGDKERRALKVFKPRYRLPMLVALADRLTQYARMPGLAVCRRTVLTPQWHGALLRQHPGLIYAVLMPWIEGPTWMQVLLQRSPLTAALSLQLARSLAALLAGMEQQGLAHCDLSGPNVMLPALADGEGVALVDVEQMYSPDLHRPPVLPGGSPGYAHRTAPEGLWALEADRFAGAVIVAEMLGWCDERVREASWGENYFDPREMQRDCARFELLSQALCEKWGSDLARLLEQAWRSAALSECPTLGEWLLLLPQSVLQPAAMPKPEPQPAPVEAQAPAMDPVDALLEAARSLEAQAKVSGALDVYRRALALAQDQPSLRAKQTLIEEAIAALERKRRPAPPSDVGISTPQLFADGLQAYQRQEWDKAQELLAEVVRRETGYAKDGVAASSLLRQVNRQRWVQRSRGWLAALAVLILAAAVWVAASMIRQAQETARARATATGVVVATGTARAQRTGTALAAAGGTAQAEMTAAAVANATSTAAAQATEMASVQATQTAVMQATSTAAAHATGTSVVVETATASSAGTATAEAIARLPTPAATAVPRVPQLITPAQGATFTGYVEMAFAWEPVGQPLGADEYYALFITFEHRDGNRYPYLQARTKETSWRGKLERFLYDGDALADRSTGWQHGWYVVVMRNPAMDDKGQITGTEVSEPSEQRSFTWKLEGGGPSGPGPGPSQQPTKTEASF